MSHLNLPDFFKDTETLKKVFPAYEVRETQIEMAKAVERAIRKGEILFVEAATGIGKTLAYLLPALLSGKRVVVSTATKTLQEQIVKKDLPLLEQLFNTSLNYVMLKGRQNYLCKRRLSRFMRQPLFSFAEETSLYEPFLEWTKRTETGDREELKGFPERLGFWEEVSSRSELCIGSKCPFFKECFITRLRREAAKADLLIVNHHLFFSDLALREKAPAEVLPEYDGVIFDEAHRVEPIATLFFGWQLSMGQVEEILRDLKRWSDQEKVDLTESLERLSRQSVRFFNTFPEKDERFRILIEELPEESRLEGDMMAETLAYLMLKLREKRGSEASGETEALLRRLEGIKGGLEAFFNSRDPNFVSWGERRKRGVILHISPIEVREFLRSALLAQVHFVVFTSATLSAGGDFSFIRERVGATEQAQTLSLPSPFDYKSRVRIFIPKDFPVPGSKAYEKALPGLVRELINSNGGRALVLFTSYRQMHRVFEKIRKALPYPVFVQGELPKSELLEAFREDRESVLFATASFWEGVDIPGDALTAVIIDKLPFFVPDDPLEAARMEAMKQRGENPFVRYQVPRAVIALKQGLGRLMRHKKDRGILAILDSRIYKRSYGKTFLRSLPPAGITHSLEDLKSFIDDTV